jgi:hypothetical protein
MVLLTMSGPDGLQMSEVPRFSCSGVDLELMAFAKVLAAIGVVTGAGQ